MISKLRELLNTPLLPQLYFGTFYMVGFLLVLYVIFVGEFDMSGQMQDVAMVLIGILSAGMGQIMNFLFGSSAGSKQKTDAITKNGKTNV